MTMYKLILTLLASLILPSTANAGILANSCGYFCPAEIAPACCTTSDGNQVCANNSCEATNLLCRTVANLQQRFWCQAIGESESTGESIGRTLTDQEARYYLRNSRIVQRYFGHSPQIIGIGVNKYRVQGNGCGGRFHVVLTHNNRVQVYKIGEILCT